MSASTASRLYRSAIRLFPMSMLSRLSGATGISLLYHMVSDQSLPHVRHLYPYKTAGQFEADLVSLKEHCRPIDYRDLPAATIPAGSALVTFDDGYAECHSVVRPLLRKHGVPCIFFVTTDWIDNKTLFFRNKVSLCIEAVDRFSDDEWSDLRTALGHALGREIVSRESFEASILGLEAEDEPRIDKLCELLGVDWRIFLAEQRPYLGLDQLKELAAEGYTIGAHGMSHRKLSRLNAEDAFREMAESCRLVREWTNQSRVPLSFPHNLAVDTNLLARLQRELPFVHGVFGNPQSSNTGVPVLRRSAADTPASNMESILRVHHGSVLAGRLAGIGLFRRV
jgi:peptidoglycan/xylan/chitin deacetylase (PgdA/CDA1 family)